MADANEPTILCIASFFKGNDFIRECKRRGGHAVLLTREKLLNEDWARESLDDLVAIPGKVSVQTYLMAASHVARQRRVTRVVALEEYDILTAANIREHLCVPGMSTTAARRFQDKLAMRARAREVEIPQPEFVQLLNYDAITEFMRQVSPPWMLKPRVGASAMGVRKLTEPAEVWSAINELDRSDAFHEQSPFHIIEQYLPGDVYHVDSLIDRGRILFSSVARYGAPPFNIAQGGGVSTSYTIEHNSREQSCLLELNSRLLTSFGIEQGVTHAEFIRLRQMPEPRATLRSAAATDQFYFLEIAARVGGAYTAETVEAASGLNLWREWARVELATPDHPYVLPERRRDYGGIAVSLARQECPDTSQYTDPEIVYRVRKLGHVGLIVRSRDWARVVQLLDEYTRRFAADFTAVAPPEQTPEEYL